MNQKSKIFPKKKVKNINAKSSLMESVRKDEQN